MTFRQLKITYFTRGFEAKSDTPYMAKLFFAGSYSQRPLLILKNRGLLLISSFSLQENKYINVTSIYVIKIFSQTNLRGISHDGCEKDRAGNFACFVEGPLEGEGGIWLTPPEHFAFAYSKCYRGHQISKFRRNAFCSEWTKVRSRFVIVRVSLQSENLIFVFIVRLIKAMRWWSMRFRS